ncbi:D-alanine--poly(phosphoribitol) ligase subunit 1 [Microdochium nivale]|nr:D-alanine--poly(phosphoribitol) ligase subunit 1 [Microdochium nivale]
MSADDRILLASSLNFNLSLASLYGAAVSGATLVIAPREAIYSPAVLVDLVLDERINRNGRMLYVGQVSGDRQVKIRGQRTELGEIEQAV